MNKWIPFHKNKNKNKNKNKKYPFLINLNNTNEFPSINNVNTKINEDIIDIDANIDNIWMYNKSVSYQENKQETIEKSDELFVLNKTNLYNLKYNNDKQLNNN